MEITWKKTFAGRFCDRSAVVTGGASGIGLTVAARLDSEGARISLWDIDDAALAAAKALLPNAHTCSEYSGR